VGVARGTMGYIIENGQNRFVGFTENYLVTIKKKSCFEKKSSDKLEKSSGLLFFIQNLNFK
jgi:hypothetical protein